MFAGKKKLSNTSAPIVPQFVGFRVGMDNGARAVPWTIWRLNRRRHLESAWKVEL